MSFNIGNEYATNNNDDLSDILSNRYGTRSNNQQMNSNVDKKLQSMENQIEKMKYMDIYLHILTMKIYLATHDLLIISFSI